MFPLEYGEVIEKLQASLDDKAGKNAQAENKDSIEEASKEDDIMPAESISQTPPTPSPLASRPDSDASSEVHHYEYISHTSLAHPESSYRALWNVVILLFLLYYAFMIPLRIAAEVPSKFYIFDYSSHSLYPTILEWSSGFIVCPLT